MVSNHVRDALTDALTAFKLSPNAQTRSAMLSAAAVGVDPGEPGDQPSPQKVEAGCAFTRNARLCIRARKRALDRRVDRPIEAAELLIVPEPQRTSLMVVKIELLERATMKERKEKTRLAKTDCPDGHCLR